MTCSRCNASYISQTTIQNALFVNLTQNTIDSMRQALQDTLNGFFNGDRHCEICDQTGVYEDVEILETNQFFHIVITSEFGRCVPLQDFELILNSGIVKSMNYSAILKDMALMTIMEFLGEYKKK